MTQHNDAPPQRYDPSAAEAKWRAEWQERGLHQFDPQSGRPSFSIDTPPPTVSGALHVGHVFSYTHTDVVARFQRMRGRNVFYPMGWDDNGLPTERRVQSLFKVRCDPCLPYEADFRPQPEAGRIVPISRRNFLELCARTSAQDESAYEETWRRLGLSVDWTRTYSTNDERCRGVSQLAFLELVRAGEAYSTDAPSVWDVDFQTAVAQAETEEREVAGLEFRLRFGLGGGGHLEIMTTRPELLGACVGVVVHPEDSRYASLVGRTAITPCYKTPVPIFAHALAEPEKGTGALMVCTFGDATDVSWWQDLGLRTRIVLGRDGRILPARWGTPGWESLDTAAAQAFHDQIGGLPARDARMEFPRLLADPRAGADGTDMAPLEGKPRPIRQTVKFYEKGERPLEILLARQWFIRLMDKKDALLEQGRKVRWHPPFMRQRYEQWVQGLKSDWCLSRQRYLGVPIPIWYPLREKSGPDYESPLLPRPERLPTDPVLEPAPGHTESQRNKPGGFVAETDVLDTWATSSLTPQIAAGWPKDECLFSRLFPMDVRAQGHEIIRTWAFYTIARSYMIHRQIPWRNALISGWVRQPGGRKMSKSRGDVVTPAALMDTYGADAIRHWAASARLGTDATYDETAFSTGKALVTKLFNASKLVLARLRAAAMAPDDVSIGDVTASLDRSQMTILASLVTDTTQQMEQFGAAAALQTIETWFWGQFCDNYLELTKTRAYSGDPSALAA